MSSEDRLKEDRLTIEVLFQEEDLDQSKRIMEEAGVEGVHEVRQKGMIGVETLIFGAITVQLLAGLTIKLVNSWKCGVIIDTRGDTVQEKRNCDLPRGSVIVLTESGDEAKLERPSEASLAKLFAEVWGARD